MSLEPLKEKEIKAIVSSVNKVLSTGNIEHLTKKAYNFLYLCSGFIAHYNHEGFKDTYSDVSDLRRNLERNYHANMWTNFRKGERDAEYYHSKAEVYKRFNIQAPQSNTFGW